MEGEWTEQTVEFQTFRMRTFEVKGKSLCPWKGNSFMTLEPQDIKCSKVPL
jgi:hypothetical protein